MIRRLRLITGLILATFVTHHLINLWTGAFSLDAMEAMRMFQFKVWGSPAMTTVLLGSLAIHMTLAFHRIYDRVHFRLPAHEWVRMVLGFSIPVLLISHFINGYLTSRILHVDTSYPYILGGLYMEGWYGILRQALLVVVVWSHMAMGIHLWLRVKPWYPKARRVLWPLSLLVPLVALIGYSRAMMDVAGWLEEPDYATELFGERQAVAADMDAALRAVEMQWLAGFVLLIVLTLIAREIRRVYRNRHGTVVVTYPSGERVTVPVGFSILDASRIRDIPHAGVCGGRGRCSTCRVRVGMGFADLPLPDPDEAAVLTRVAAASDVRLACQTRPRRDLSVTPLLPPTAGIQQALRPGGVSGHEAHVVIVFIDIRGSTALGERNLPYDVVFILNEFFAEMSLALDATGGHYAQFTGDGLMALYGVECDFPKACWQAIEGAAEMFRRLERINRRFAGELAQPIRIGIGIHGGVAIVGTMGPPSSPVLSAIGDTVNVAARLEAQTKIVGRPLVISEAVAQAAGLPFKPEDVSEVTVAGREGSISIVSIAEPASLSLKALVA